MVTIGSSQTRTASHLALRPVSPTALPPGLCQTTAQHTQLLAFRGKRLVEIATCTNGRGSGVSFPPGYFVEVYNAVSFYKAAIRLSCCH